MLDSEAIWLPSSNFTRGRWLPGVGYVKPKYAIFHTTEGGYDSSLDWLRGAAAGSSNRESSAHYLMGDQGAPLAGMVDERDTAWTAGNYDYNVLSVNVELVGYAGIGGFSDILYQRAGELGARIAARWGFPIDREHFIGHGEVPYQNHWDPGPHFDWDKLMFAAKGRQVVSETAKKIWYFPETGKYLHGGFLGFWLANGGVKVFGFPITDEIQTGNPANPAIQWFERARFEWWPETDSTNYDVRLGRIGAELYDKV